MDTTKTYSTGGINWCWYIKVEEHDDGTVTVLAHDRLHNFDNDQGAGRHPADAIGGGGMRFVETDGRVAVALDYFQRGVPPRPLRNPGYVFGFGRL